MALHVSSFGATFWSSTIKGTCFIIAMDLSIMSYTVITTKQVTTVHVWVLSVKRFLVRMYLKIGTFFVASCLMSGCSAGSL
jgi:hypothetical protein